MSNSYDYIAVSTESELITAYTKVMSESSIDQNLKLQMAEASQFPYYELANAMKSICNQNPGIFSLVNNQIEETRTAESWKRQKEMKGIGELKRYKL